WALGLAHLAELREFDAQAAQRSSLTGRVLEPWRAILAVALWLQEKHGIAGLFDRMELLSQTYQKERGELEFSNPGLVMLVALNQMMDGRDSLELVPKDVAAQMNQLARDQDLVEEGKDFTNHWRVGWLLKRLRFRRLPNAGTKRWEMSRAD